MVTASGASWLAGALGAESSPLGLLGPLTGPKLPSLVPGRPGPNHWEPQDRRAQVFAHQAPRPRPSVGSRYGGQAWKGDMAFLGVRGGRSLIS